MNEKKITYPVAFAFLSFISFGLIFLYFVFEIPVFTVIIFGLLSILFAIVSLIGGGLNIKKRKNVRQSVLSIILSSVSISFILLAQLYSMNYWNKFQKSSGKMSTIYEMETLAQSFQRFSVEENKKMPSNMDEFLTSLGDSNEKERILFLGNIEDLKKGFCKDGWGNPILLVENSSTEYKLISYGYNGKDDKGKKDDIVFTFNPLGSDYKNKTILLHYGTTDE